MSDVMPPSNFRSNMSGRETARDDRRAGDMAAAVTA